MTSLGQCPTPPRCVAQECTDTHSLTRGQQPLCSTKTQYTQRRLDESVTCSMLDGSSACGVAFCRAWAGRSGRAHLVTADLPEGEADLYGAKAGVAVVEHLAEDGCEEAARAWLARRGPGKPAKEPRGLADAGLPHAEDGVIEPPRDVLHGKLQQLPW